MPVLTRKRRRGSRLIFNFELTALAVFFVLVAAAGATYEAIAGWDESQRFPQIGRSVDIGGFKLNINCTGEGSPTVVLDSGVGGPALAWALVQPRIAQFTRVCSYDRAGYGWSDPGPQPRTSSREADELHTLLQRASVSPPYVLVGHSLGGFNVRIFAARYPVEVAGMVLVDASHEDQIAKGFAPTISPLRPLAPALLRLGLLRAAFYFQGERRAPDPLRSELEYLMLQPKAIDTSFAEVESFDESSNQVRKAGKLGDMPLVVVTGAMPEARSLKLHKIWTDELQPSLVRLSSSGRQIIAENSGHNVPIEEPGAVVRAVREIVGGP